MPSCSGSEWTDVDCWSRASCPQRQYASLSGGDFATRHALRLDEEAHQRVAAARPKLGERLSTSPVAGAVDGQVLPFYDLVAEPPTCSTLASTVKPKPSAGLYPVSPFWDIGPTPEASGDQEICGGSGDRGASTTTPARRMR